MVKIQMPTASSLLGGMCLFAAFRLLSTMLRLSDFSLRYLGIGPR